MAMLGPFADDKGVVVMQDRASNGVFKRVAYGHSAGSLERWWLYEPGGSGPLAYRPPGYARPKQLTRFRYVGDWTSATWVDKIRDAHTDRDALPDGHPHAPGIPHKGMASFAYVKGERTILDTLPSTVARLESMIPKPPTPATCPGGSSPEIDPGFLRIHPIGQSSLLGYIFVPTGGSSSSDVFDNVEYWMLIDDARFPRPSAAPDAGFEVIQRHEVTAPTTLDQSVIDFFAKYWVTGRSSLTIVRTRWYACRLADADL